MTFGKLTVVREVEKFTQPSGQTQRGFLCRCKCGVEKRIRLSHLRRGAVVACGCMGGRNVRHGEYKTGLYKVWRGMIDRATGASKASRKHYLDRGIGICEEWRHNFPAFAEWARQNGYQKGLTIDREKNHLGYSPDNCRFVTPTVNANNRRNTFLVEYRGKSEPFLPLLRRLKLLRHVGAIRGRLKRGWIAARALSVPIRTGKYRRTA